MPEALPGERRGRAGGRFSSRLRRRHAKSRTVIRAQLVDGPWSAAALEERPWFWIWEWACAAERARVLGARTRAPQRGRRALEMGTERSCSVQRDRRRFCGAVGAASRGGRTKGGIVFLHLNKRLLSGRRAPARSTSHTRTQTRPEDTNPRCRRAARRSTTRCSPRRRPRA